MWLEAAAPWVTAGVSLPLLSLASTWMHSAMASYGRLRPQGMTGVFPSVSLERPETRGTLQKTPPSPDRASVRFRQRSIGREGTVDRGEHDLHFQQSAGFEQLPKTSVRQVTSSWLGLAFGPIPMYGGSL